MTISAILSKKSILNSTREKLLLLTCATIFTHGSLMADEMESTMARGGMLYDNWAKVTEADAPKKSHPSYPSDKKYANKPESNWRCKECHGWDYMGKDGAYSKGKHATGIVGINKAKGRDTGEIIKILADDNHRYGKVLNKDDMYAVSLFVSKGQVNMDQYIDRASKMPKGDKAKGAAYYNTVCAKCHGENGLLPKEMKPFGAQMSSNPWEVMHKIHNGQPDEVMPSLRAFDRQITADIMSHMTTLPKKR